MSYDLSLLATHRSATPVRRINPFTAKEHETYVYTLTEQELRSANAVLTRYQAKDDDGDKIVSFATGERLRMSTREEAWNVDLRSLSTEVVKFLFELSAAGDFLIIDDNVAVTTSAATKERLKDFPSASGCVVVTSAEELGVLLKDGFEAWQAYAKRVGGAK